MRHTRRTVSDPNPVLQEGEAVAGVVRGVNRILVLSEWRRYIIVSVRRRMPRRHAALRLLVGEV